MSVVLSRQSIRKWIDHAIEGFRQQDLLGVPDSWLRIYEALTDYIVAEKAPDQQLLWMLEGTDDDLPDIIYQLQRLKNALFDNMLGTADAEEFKQLIGWFDRTIVILVEKSTGRVSEERSLLEPYETIFWKARDGMYISTMEGKFIHCNEAMLKMLEYDSLEALLEMDISAELYVDQQDRQMLLEHLRKDGFFDHHEFCFRNSDGEVKTALESCYLVKAPNGSEYIVGLLVDVTQEKESQRQFEDYICKIEAEGIEAHLAKRSANDRFETLLQINPHAVVTVDPKNLGFLQANQAFLKRFKYGKKQLEKLGLRALFSPDSWRRLYAEITQAANGNTFLVKDMSCQPKANGSPSVPFLAEISGVLHQDKEGTVLFLQIEDRSGVLAAKQMVDHLRQNLEALHKTIRVGMIGFKADGSVAFVNRFLLEELGYGNRKLTNLSFISQLFHKDEQRLKFHKYVSQFLKGQNAENVEVELRAKSGKILSCRLDTIPYAFPGESEPGFIALLTDHSAEVDLAKLQRTHFSEPGALEQECRLLQERAVDLEKQLEELGRRDSFKREFLFNFGKIFKVPIHVVLGYASLLRRELFTVLTDSQKEDVQIIQRHIHMLLTMVDMANEFVQLLGGEVEPHPEEVGARRLIDDLFERLTPDAMPDGIAFSAKNSLLSLEWRITTDSQYLETLIRHLLENAIQFTTQGEIELTAYEEEGSLWFRLRDTGRGISPNDMARIFDPFFRGATEDGGPEQVRLGLGLSIVKAYAELLGIELEVQSKSGESTTVILGLGPLID